jgi:hypothetical protein
MVYAPREIKISKPPEFLRSWRFDRLDTMTIHWGGSMHRTVSDDASREERDPRVATTDAAARLPDAYARREAGVYRNRR